MSGDRERPAVLGSVLDGVRLDDPSARVGLLKVGVRSDWLRSGGTLTIDLPRRVACAACEGGGCSRCGNSGGYRLGDAKRAPVRVEIAPSTRERVRVRVALSGSEEIDQVVFEMVSAEAPSAFVRYRPRAVMISRAAPVPRVSANGILATTIALFALGLTIVITLLMRS